MERDALERLVGGRLRHSFEEILNHAQLPSARRAYLQSFLDVYEGDPFLLAIMPARFDAAFVFQSPQPNLRESWTFILHE